MTVENHHYLIIGGAPKAGTTSLYKWLSDHPQVCASTFKETRFFLDEDYPVPRAARFDGTNLHEYDGFFKHCGEDGSILRVDASPDYLYSRTAVRIAELLPKARMVFIIRDPVERMVSWYKYARQRRLLGKETSFEDYIMAQVGQPIRSGTRIHLRALDQCRYDTYLKPFRDAFGDRCLVLDFNDVKNDPCSIMMKLCKFAGLDGSFYDSYAFRAENVSRVVRVGWIMSRYSAIRRRVAYALYNSPAIIKLLKKPNRIIKKLLFATEKACEEVAVSPKLSDLIRREVSR
jgi:hypothetical protein